MGALPSGGDPTQVSVGDFGIFGAGFSGLENITQDVVQQFYNAAAKGNETLKNMSDLVFQGLDSSLGLVYGIVAAIIQKLFPFLDIPANINDLLDSLDDVPLIGDLIDSITTAVGIVTSPDPITAAFEAIQHLLGIGTGAQSSADTANVGLAILNARVNDIIAGGVSLYDTFSRDGGYGGVSTDLGSDYYVVYQGGTGAWGTVSADDGRARWAASSYLDRAVSAINLTPMGTNRSRVSVVIDGFVYGAAGNQANIYLIGRSDVTMNDYVIGIIGVGYCEIGYVSGTTYTRFGAQEAISNSAGDLWDFEVGQPGDEWRFRLVQNNSVRCDRTDLAHSSQKDTVPGTTYAYTGLGGDQAIGAGILGTTFQVAMPDFQVFAASDF